LQFCKKETQILEMLTFFLPLLLSLLGATTWDSSSLLLPSFFFSYVVSSLSIEQIVNIYLL
jgi:hypothetical protein